MILIIITTVRVSIATTIIMMTIIYDINNNNNSKSINSNYNNNDDNNLEMISSFSKAFLPIHFEPYHRFSCKKLQKEPGTRRLKIQQLTSEQVSLELSFASGT